MAYRFLSSSTRSTALNKLLVQKTHFFKRVGGGWGVGRRGSVKYQMAVNIADSTILCQLSNGKV